MRLMMACVLATLALTTQALTTQAATQTTCPPLGALPGYVAEPATLLSYMTVEFKRAIPGSDEFEAVPIAGRYCKLNAAPATGRDPMSNLELQLNYRAQLEAMGAEILAAADLNLWARLAKNGTETWTQISFQEGNVQIQTVLKQPPRITLLPPGPNDFRLLGHMPGHTSEKPVLRNFDQMEFDILDGDASRTVKVQGRTTTIRYTPPSGSQTTDEEIEANYRDALQKLGAEILRERDLDTTARLVSNGQVVWIKISSQEAQVKIEAVEEKPFEPAIKPAPDTLRAALDKAGRVALYINFEFAKATLRPDSAPVVAQVLALLKADPTLRLSIEGHTDDIGPAPLNQTLSNDRAAALMAALTTAGIPPARLTSIGYGATKPLTTNDTSEGRARNRRVELVKP